MGLFTRKDTSTSSTKAGTGTNTAETGTEQQEPTLNTTSGYAVAATAADAISSSAASMSRTAKTGEDVTEQADAGERQELPLDQRSVDATIVAAQSRDATTKTGQRVTEQADAGERSETPLDTYLYGKDTPFFTRQTKTGQRVAEQPDRGAQPEQPIDVTSGQAVVSAAAYARCDTPTEAPTEAPAAPAVDPVVERNAKVFNLCGTVYFDGDNIAAVLAAVGTDTQSFSYSERNSGNNTIVVVNSETRTVKLIDVEDLDELAEAVNDGIDWQRENNQPFDLATIIAESLDDFDGYHTTKF